MNIYLVDSSGSMSNEMLARAWAFVSKRFTIGDAVIAFSTGARLIVRPGELPKKDFLSIIRRATDNKDVWRHGGTCLKEAFKFVDELKRRRFDNQNLTKVILVTDGYLSDEDKQSVNESILIDPQD